MRPSGHQTGQNLPWPGGARLDVRHGVRRPPPSRQDRQPGMRLWYHQDREAEALILGPDIHPG
jgi:hypothetical protein